MKKILHFFSGQIFYLKYWEFCPKILLYLFNNIECHVLVYLALFLENVWKLTTIKKVATWNDHKQRERTASEKNKQLRLRMQLSGRHVFILIFRNVGQYSSTTEPWDFWFVIFFTPCWHHEAVNQKQVFSS